MSVSEVPTDKDSNLPVPLNLRVLERFRIAAAPNTQVVVGYGGVEVHGHVHVLEVAFLSRVPELS